ncbi:MAG: helix-turn-helix domain-containing protein [Candidatus Krumholzibacteria bacterium]|nr:helix-turn-helix domain-containing protein [Candidatus Krumholzibacteria bacterium]MDH4335770.1 helix-turn-helix domain-containing protein [Candidatus Krumholzibacteria bacterium]MDH5269296.1 helix-turn-helix domain-containing protein [Candidatus Krumholzibacteria bacterium]
MPSQETNSSDTQWLTLTEAAEALRVHPTTLRRWADSGQVPVFLTPGGHRRFAMSDVRDIAARRHSVRRVGPVERIWAEQALKQARIKIAEQEQSRWMKIQDDRGRDKHRNMGQQLMGLILEFLTTEEEDENLIRRAREFGRHYGRASREIRLPLTEALQAAMFFRDTLTTTAVQLPDNIRIPTSSQVRLIHRIGRIVNEVQLGVADAYSVA